MTYYKVDIEATWFEEYYVKAKNKTEAIEEAKKQCGADGGMVTKEVTKILKKDWNYKKP